jgi:hypothetical protein
MEEMRYRTFGRSGLRVSELFLGAMTFGQSWGWGAPAEECRKILDAYAYAYAEADGNVIDTANRYAAGLLWLTRLSPGASYWTHLAPPMLIISLGLGQIFVPMSSTALLGVAPADAGIASALVNTTQQTGGSLGVAFLNTAATAVTARYALTHHGLSPAAAVHGFTTAFAISAGFMAVAAVAVTALIRPRGAGSTGPASSSAAPSPDAYTART